MTHYEVVASRCSGDSEIWALKVTEYSVLVKQSPQAYSVIVFTCASRRYDTLRGMCVTTLSDNGMGVKGYKIGTLVTRDT